MRVRHDSTQATYSERVLVRQVEIQAIELLYTKFDGHTGVARPQCANGKPLYCWEVTSIKAATFLRAILPHLRIKKEQALNCLALRDVKEQSKIARVAVGRGHVGASVRPVELTQRMEALFQRAHELNRVGRGVI